MAGTLPGTGMGGRLRNLYAEDETEVAKLRQARQDEDEMATSVGRWRAAQRLFGGKPEGSDPRPSTATERLQEETALRTQLGSKREQARDTGSLAAYLERQGVDAESANVMARNPKILDAWNQGRGRQEDRDFRAAQAREDRDFRAGEGAKSRAHQIRLAKMRPQGGGGGGRRDPTPEAWDSRHEPLLQKMGNEIRLAQPLVENIAELERIANQPGNIPGAGPIGSRVPSWAQSSEALNVNQRVNAVVNRLLQIQSGAAVSEPEVERKRNELGLGTGQSEEAFRTGVRRLKAEMDSAMQGLVRQQPPAVVREYVRRGGVLPPGLDLSGLGVRPPAETGSFDVSGGGQLGPEDQAALEWARSNPDDPRAAEIVQRLGGE